MLTSCADSRVGHDQPHLLAVTVTVTCCMLLRGVQGPCSIAATTSTVPTRVLGRDAGTCTVTVSLPRGTTGAMQANLTLAVVTVEDVRLVLGPPEASQAPLEETDQVGKGQASPAQAFAIAGSQVQPECLAVLPQRR